MGYAVSFKVKVEGAGKYIAVGNCNAYIPEGAQEILTRATGLEWKKGTNNGRCIDIMPYIEKGFTALLKHPEQYRQYEVITEFDNVWLSVTGVRTFLKDILNAWFDFCTNDAHKGVVKFVTFWIE